MPLIPGAERSSALVVDVRDRVERKAAGLRGPRRRRVAAAINVRSGRDMRTHVGAMRTVGRCYGHCRSAHCCTLRDEREDG